MKTFPDEVVALFESESNSVLEEMEKRRKEVAVRQGIIEEIANKTGVSIDRLLLIIKEWGK